MLFNDTYRKYLEHQAKSHPSLLFEEGKKVFEMIGVEEAVGDFRSQVVNKGFIMRGIWYTYQISDNYAADAMKICTGGFIVAKYHSARAQGTDAFNAAMKESEQIVDEIVEKMIADSNDGHPLFYYSLNTAQQFNISPKPAMADGNYSGYLCTFRFNNHWRNCVTADAAPAWTDGGTTPHIL